MILDHIMKSGGLCHSNDDLILELIKVESQSLLNNDSLIRYILNSRNQKLITELNKTVFNDHDLLDQVNGFYNPPQNILVEYFPLQDNYIVLSDKLLPETVFQIPESKKDILKKIVTDNDSSFKLRFELSKHSFLSYSHQDIQIADAIISQHKKLMAIAIAGAILFSSVSNYIQLLDTEAKIQSKAPKNFIDSLFFKNFGNVVNEIERLPKSDSIIVAINNLNQDDFKLINDLNSTNDVSETQDQYRDSIVNNLVSIIKSIQNERIKFKTQIKIQDDDSIQSIAESIVNEAIANNIDYRILSSIIMQESKFDQGSVSSSGDIALTQINYEIWSPEFQKMGIQLSKEQLKKDENYAIWAMGKILSTIRSRHGSDPYWYARYHSGTPSRKLNYAQLVNSHFYDINQKQLALAQEKVDLILFEIKKSNYKENDDIDVSKIDSFVFQLIQVKFNLEKQVIPSRIASN